MRRIVYDNIYMCFKATCWIFQMPLTIDEFTPQRTTFNINWCLGESEIKNTTLLSDSNKRRIINTKYKYKSNSSWFFCFTLKWLDRLYTKLTHICGPHIGGHRHAHSASSCSYRGINRWWAWSVWLALTEWPKCRYADLLFKHLKSVQHGSKTILVTQYLDWVRSLVKAIL